MNYLLRSVPFFLTGALVLLSSSAGAAQNFPKEPQLSTSVSGYINCKHEGWGVMKRNMEKIKAQEGASYYMLFDVDGFANYYFFFPTGKGIDTLYANSFHARMERELCPR